MSPLIQVLAYVGGFVVVAGIIIGYSYLYPDKEFPSLPSIYPMQKIPPLNQTQTSAPFNPNSTLLKNQLSSRSNVAFAFDPSVEEEKLETWVR